MKLAMVFPGQGSQAVGMLRGYGGLPGVAQTLAEAADALGAEFVRLLDEGPAEKLNLTLNTQPAMVTAGTAALRAWRMRSSSPCSFLRRSSIAFHWVTSSATSPPRRRTSSMRLGSSTWRRYASRA